MQQQPSSSGEGRPRPRWDSGLGKENLPKCDSDLSLYNQEDDDPDSANVDSGCEDEKWRPFDDASADHRGWLPTKRSRSSTSLNEDLEQFVDLSHVEFNANTQLPSDFSTLLCSSPMFQRSVSLNAETDTPPTARFQHKKPKPEDLQKPGRSLLRSTSVTEENIKCALQRSSTEPNLIGDFSRLCRLPVKSGHHPDLKYITADTLALLMRGEYANSVPSFQIIDCRFPYEFEGGHISDAVNLYTREQLVKLLEVDESKQLLVFHCEFSSERGPNLCRLLRKLDRSRNNYPKLNFPEIYLLEGGYKKFYEHFSELCMPRSYKPMLHPAHQEDLRYFKSHTKSVQESDAHRPAKKGSFKRLRFP